MDKPVKFLLPSPNFGKKAEDANKTKPHFLTPSGMTLLTRENQPPPMYGKRGATVPAKFLQHVAQTQQETARQYCEACELELHSLEDLKRHRAQHENCPVDGCQYRGHPSVMDKHVTVLHSSGLFDKFNKLSTPEEIAAWRNERRKRYPTVANVLLKQKAQEQRQKRGERLEANKSRFGRQDDRKRALPSNETKSNANKTEDNAGPDNTTPTNKNKNKRKRKNKREKRQDTKPKDGSSQKPNTAVENIDNLYEYPMFCGTRKMKDYKHFDEKKKPAKNALFGLVGMYGSDDDSESCSSDNDVAEIISDKSPANDDSLCGDKPTELNESNCHISEAVLKDDQQNDFRSPDVDESSKNKKESIHNCNLVKEVTEQPSTSIATCVPTPTSNINSSDEAPEEAPIERSIPEYQIQNKLPNLTNPEAVAVPAEGPPHKRAKQTDDKPIAKQMIKRKSGLDYRKLRLRKQNTMLEKLLESEIRHERNVLLQCVRYVCENNFFGVESTEKPKPT